MADDTFSEAKTCFEENVNKLLGSHGHLSPDGRILWNLSAGLLRLTGAVERECLVLRQKIDALA